MARRDDAFRFMDRASVEWRAENGCVFVRAVGASRIYRMSLERKPAEKKIKSRPHCGVVC